MTRRRIELGVFLAAIAVASVVLAAAMLPALAQAAPAGLPPRPTPTPIPGATAAPPATKPSQQNGALISLEVNFGDSWPSLGVEWQDLWTVVQWQDENGNWNQVEGWQGALDKVASGSGWKTWWLPEDLFGTGPFRWMVYTNLDGQILFAGDLFYLPNSHGQIFAVEAPLAP